MGQTIWLNPQQVPANLKVIFDVLDVPGQERRTTKFKFEVVDQIELQGMTWSGGSVNEYMAVNLATGEAKPLTDPRPWPQNQYPLPPFPMKPEWAIAKRTTFKGKNMGVTFYIHPDNAPRMLPEPDADSVLPRDEQIVLIATRSLKPSYGGISNYRYHEAKRETGITPERWQKAKDDLIAKKLLRKNGSITPDGRNAIAEFGTQGLSAFRESRKTFSQLARLAEAK